MIKTIVFFIIILLIIYVLENNYIEQYNYFELNNKIDYYVITLKNQDRIENIINQ
jgi:hypothetical protein